MDLKAYLRGLSADQRRRYAELAGTVPVYLSQLAHGHRKPSAELARRLHDASGFSVSLSSLRPDLWPPNQAA